MQSPAGSDVLAALARHHAEIEDRFDRVQRATDAGERAREFEALVNALAIHAAVEEQVFYPAVAGPHTRLLLRRAVQTHLRIKRTLADVSAMSVRSWSFPARLAELHRLFTTHAAAEDEGLLFPEVRATLSPRELDVLADDCAAMVEGVKRDRGWRRVLAELSAVAMLPILPSVA